MMATDCAPSATASCAKAAPCWESDGAVRKKVPWGSALRRGAVEATEIYELDPGPDAGKLLT